MTGQPDENEGEAEEGLPGETSDVAGETYRWDLLRGSMQGFVEACMVTFGLLVAIRVFDAPDMLKAILPGSYSGGLLISPLTIIIASRWGWTAGRTCALYSLLGGLSMIGAVSVRALPAFLVFIVLVAVFLAQTVPLLTKIYASNYAERERGSRYSTSVLFSAVIAAGFSYGGGLLLDLDIEFYRFVFLVPAFALFVNILAFNRMPAVAIHPEQSKNPVSDFKKAIRNRVFCMILVGWMFQGFGQVMTMPIRVEYLANERYGINATNEQIALIIGVVPFLTYLLSTKFWGYCFDRWNFIVLRVIMNVIAMVSIFTVFFYFLPLDDRPRNGLVRNFSERRTYSLDALGGPAGPAGPVVYLHGNPYLFYWSARGSGTLCCLSAGRTVGSKACGMDRRGHNHDWYMHHATVSRQISTELW